MLWFSKSATGLAARGLSYSNEGQFDLAIAKFDEAIKLDPQCANFFGLRAFAYGAKGQHDRSIADCDEAIRRNSKNADYFSMRGVAHALIGQLDLAIADFDAAILLDSHRADFFHGRGCTYYNKGQDDRAARDYTEANRLDPNLAVLFKNSGVARFNNGAYDLAIEDFTEAIRLNPNDAFSFVSRGVVYATKGQPDPAISDFSEAIRLDPQNSLALDNRGGAYGKKGEFERAIADHDEAIKLDPKDAIFFFNRGTTYYLARQYDPAIADYDEAIRLDPNLTQAIGGRAKAIDRKNDFWGCFHGIPNTKTVLEDKADVVARLIAQSCDDGPQFAASMMKDLPELRFGEDDAQRAMLETAAFLVCVVSRLAFTFLNSESRDIFIDALRLSMPSRLRDKGIDPTSFLDLLNKRHQEYAQYQKWVPDKGERPGGTLFWEFGKIAAAALNVGPNLVFDTFLTTSLLKSLDRWKLNKLLQGSPELAAQS